MRRGSWKSGNYPKPQSSKPGRSTSWRWRWRRRWRRRAGDRRSRVEPPRPLPRWKLEVRSWLLEVRLPALLPPFPRWELGVRNWMLEIRLFRPYLPFCALSSTISSRKNLISRSWTLRTGPVISSLPSGSLTTAPPSGKPTSPPPSNLSHTPLSHHLPTPAAGASNSRPQLFQNWKLEVPSWMFDVRLLVTLHPFLPSPAPAPGPS